MAEEKVGPRDLNFRELCPWLGLFRTFSIAIDLKKLVLAAAGLLFMTVGWWFLAILFLWGAPENEQLEERAESIGQYTMDPSGIARWPWDPGRWEPFSVDGKTGLGTVEVLWTNPLGTLRELVTHWRFILRPVYDLVTPFQTLFTESEFVAVAFSFLCGIWAIAVWAFFGGAITRIAAVQFAREERVSLRESIRFARTKYLSFLSGPLVPLLVVALIVLCCFVGGLVSGIPGFGPLFAGALWFLPLIAGFCMAFLLLGLTVGWPLMFATVSVEGSDTFDAMSRTYAYVIQRPWHYLFYVLTAVVYGSLCAYFVLLFADLLVYLGDWAVVYGTSIWGESGRELTSQLAFYAPEASGWRPTEALPAGDPDSLPVIGPFPPEGTVWLGAVFMGVWLHVAFLLVAGFVYSYFWSASTIIYYLLRHDVDSIELQEVYVEGGDEDLDFPAKPTPAEEGAPAAAGESSEPAPPTDPGATSSANP